MSLDDFRPHDHLGRLEPHRLDVLSFAHAIPGFAAQFVEVPAAHVERMLDIKTQMLTCPCGAHLPIERLRLHPCEGCGRIYTYVGGRLLAANRPNAEGARDVSRQSEALA